MKRWRWAAVPLLLIVLLLAGRLVLLRGSLPSGTPTAVPQQIYVAQVQGTELELISTSNATLALTKGSLVDFNAGQTFATTATGSGYVQLGFPGQAQLYMAGSTALLLQQPLDENPGVRVRLDKGSVLVKLPDPSPALRVTVQSLNGAQVWVSGSMLGLQYDASQQVLYADCLEGTCGYTGGSSSQNLPAGSHVALRGTTVLSTGTGSRNELWQFVPGAIATPTLSPSATPNLAATQSCRYFTSLGLSCAAGFPTLTITPSVTPDYAATEACRRAYNLGTPCP